MKTSNRDYRKNFSQAYRHLYQDNYKLCYLTEILDSAQEGQLFLCVNGEKFFFSKEERSASFSLEKTRDYSRQRLSATLSLSLSLSLFSDLALLFSLLSLSKNDVRKCCFVLASSRARTRTTALSFVSLTSRVDCFLLMKPLY